MRIQNVKTDKVLYCLIVAVLFCIGNLLKSQTAKVLLQFDVAEEGRSQTIKVNSVIIRLGLSDCFGLGAPAVKCFDLFGIEYKILDFSRP